jgi:hypothetical protein
LDQRYERDATAGGSCIFVVAVVAKHLYNIVLLELLWTAGGSSISRVDNNDSDSVSAVSSPLIVESSLIISPLLSVVTLFLFASTPILFVLLVVQHVVIKVVNQLEKSLGIFAALRKFSAGRVSGIKKKTAMKLIVHSRTETRFGRKKGYDSRNW